MIEIGATNLSVASLKAAISRAGTTRQDDLIVVRTTNAVNTITYADPSDGVEIDIDSSKYGALNVVAFGTKPLTINAARSMRVLTSTSGTVGVANLTITGGGEIYHCGGVYVDFGSFTLTNSTISGNSAYGSGGGVYVDSGSFTSMNSVITGNSATYGGGVYVGSNGSFTSTNTVISGNSASLDGAGVFVGINSIFTSTNTTISDNFCASTPITSGGGVYVSYGGIFTSTNTTISGNSAIYGGGVRIYENGIFTSTNTVISDNSALREGGGVYVNGCFTTTNATISGNSATRGGGVYVDSETGSFKSTNSIISLNYASDSDSNLLGTLAVASSNNIIGNSPSFVCAPIFAGGKLTNAETLDLHLGGDSVAIDAGSNAAVAGILTDIEGNPRIYNGTVDIGAYEYVEVNPLLVTTEEDVVNPDDGETSLREAISAVETGKYGTTVTFAASLKGKTITLNGAELRIGKSLTIDASSLYDVETKTPGVTINVAQKSRVFNIEGGLEESSVVFDGLNVTGGWTLFSGGGIYAGDNSTLTVRNSTISENESGGGGGIYSTGTLVVENSAISKNKATGGNAYGGGIYADIGKLTVKDTTISENSAERGGGIYTTYGSPTLTNATITKNEATNGDGGGIYASKGELTLTGATISENKASDKGGAIYSIGPLTATNAAIFANSASDVGGVFSQGTTIMTNATISGNVASNDVGGLETTGTLALRNSIVARNTAKSNPDYDFQSTVVDSSNNALGFDPGFVVAPVFDEEGKLTNAATLDLKLKADAWGADRGDNSFVATTTDAAGKARVVGTVDLGAYESEKPSEKPSEKKETPSLIVTTNEDVVKNDDKISLREAIFYAKPGETITFADDLKGKTITLKDSEICVDKGVSIDASSSTQASPVTINADNKSRAFYLFSGTEETPASLTSLKITDGSTGGSGGGIFALDVSTLTNPSVSSNKAKKYGGGVFADGTSTLNNVLVAENEANLGGGIFASGEADLTATNVTISGNSDSDSGGGIYVYRGKFTARNSVIVGNSNGDVYNSSLVDEAGEIHAFNVPSSAHGFFGSEGVVDYQQLEPLFKDAEKGDYSLVEGSQALDIGDAGYVSTQTDLAGNARISGFGVDLGAYEYQPPLSGVALSATSPLVGEPITAVVYAYSGALALPSAAATYQWYRLASPKSDRPTEIVGATNSTYVPTSQDNGYYLRVVATSVSGLGYSGSVKATTSSPTTNIISNVPSAPSGVIFGAYDETTQSVLVSWVDNSSNEENFRVEISSDGENWALVGTPEANATSTTISGLDYGTYTVRVRAENADGASAWTSNESTIVAPGVPVAPSKVVLGVYDKSTQCASILWGDVSLNEENFRVEISSDGENWTLVGAPKANATSTPLPALDAGTYFARVRAENSFGASDWTVAEFILATPEAPSGIIYDKYDPISQSVSISWVGNSSSEENFRVEISSDGEIWTLVGTPDANVRATKLTSIDSGTYFVRVRAENFVGASNWTVEKLTFQVDSFSPSDLTLGTYDANTRSVVLSWTDNSNDETGFRIEYTTDGGKNWQVLQNSAVNATSRTVWDVKPNAKYDFRICAIRNGEQTEWEYSKTLNTLVVPPKAPGFLTVSAYDATTKSVSLTWSDDSNDETGFYVEYSTDGGKTWFFSQKTRFGVESAVVSGVKPNKTYEFRVCAVRSNDQSQWTRSEPTITSVVKPTAPDGLTLGAYDAASRSVVLSWKDNSNDETGFRIEYSTDGGAKWRYAQTVNSNATSRVLWNVEPDASYMFRICAICRGEQSAQSYSETLDTTVGKTQGLAFAPIASSPFDVPYAGRYALTLPVAVPLVEQANVRAALIEEAFEETPYGPFYADEFDCEFARERVVDSSESSPFVDLFDDDLLAVEF